MSQNYDPSLPISGTTKFGDLYATIRALLQSIVSTHYGTANPNNLQQGQLFVKEVAGVPRLYWYSGSAVNGAGDLIDELVQARGGNATLLARLAASDASFLLLLNEMIAARGTATSLAARLNIYFNPDGTARNPTPQGGWWNIISGCSYRGNNLLSISGEMTSLFTIGRAIRTMNSGSSFTFSRVVQSIYSGSVTFVTVDTPNIPASLTTVEFGQDPANSPSSTGALWTMLASPTKTGSQTFTCTGDQTATCIATRAIRFETSSLVYSKDYIVSSSYSSGTGLTTVVVQGSVPSSFLSVAIGQEPGNQPFIGGLSLIAPIMTGLAASDIEGNIQSITISNYDAANTYNISVSGGSASRTGDTINWTLPAVSADTSHTITVYASRSGYSNSYSAVLSITVQNFVCPTPTLTGNATVQEGQTFSGTISNYNVLNTYTWSASPSSPALSGLTNSGGTWSFTAPAVTADTEFTISVYATHSVYGQSTTTTKTVTVQDIPIGPGADIVFSINSTGFPDGTFV